MLDKLGLSLLESSKGEPDPIITHSRLTSGYESFRRRSNSMDSFFRCPFISLIAALFVSRTLAI